MTAFHFALQPLLDARSRIETECRGALAGAARAAAAEQARADEAHAEFARAGRRFRDSATLLPPIAVRETLDQLSLLADAVERARERARVCAEQAWRAREAFLAARRELERIEALRDQAFVAHTRAAERRTALDLDDANEARHNSATLVAPSFHN